MEFSNIGASIYHNIQAVYSRDQEGRLLRMIGAGKRDFENSWEIIRNALLKSDQENWPSHIPLSIDSTKFTFSEKQRPGENEILGIIQHASLADQPFHQSFISLLLSQMSLHLTKSPPIKDSIQVQTERIVRLFDDRLRHISINDQWDFDGREYFQKRVYHYTSRNQPVEFCLPAFPCKSSNQDKVMGTMPDRGEEMGLLKLHGFAREIKKIYPPGAKIWIISDGHVFSDCVGVDDTVVDAYTLELQKMNNRIGKAQDSRDQIGFKSLVDLFDLQNASPASPTLAQHFIPEIHHHVDTKLEEEAETSRRILMAGCQSDRAALRRDIDLGDPAVLALYRGFSRFMLEDLEMHCSTKNMSKSERKKLSKKVAFEMIQRNQAYSNLVELLFPDHVRLSIHAHNNSGPKFGIRLFEKGVCKPISMLSQDPGIGGNSDDLLHIPTPWHNCIVEVAGDSKIYVGKSRVIVDALEKGLYTGGWKEGHSGKAGCFEVARVLQSQSNNVLTAVPTIRSDEIGVTNLLGFIKDRPQTYGRKGCFSDLGYINERLVGL